MLLTVIPLCYAQKWIAHISLCPFTLFKERLERFVPIALYKRVTVSDSLKSHMTKERPKGIRSGLSRQKSDGSDLLFFASELLFSSQETSKLLKKPLSKFPTLDMTMSNIWQFCFCELNSTVQFSNNLSLDILSEKSNLRSPWTQYYTFKFSKFLEWFRSYLQIKCWAL